MAADLFGFPHFDGAIMRAGVDQPVSSPLDAAHGGRVLRQRKQQSPRAPIPDTDTSVLGGAGKACAFRISSPQRLHTSIHQLRGWWKAYKWNGSQQIAVTHLEW